MHSPSIYIYPYIYLYIYRKIAASCTTRLARSRSPITGAAHTVIPIQRQHAHKIAISVYIYIHVHLTIYCTRDRYRRKMRLASESAEEEETRLCRREVARRDRARRAAQSSQATINCRGSETAGARERRSTRDRDRRKRRLDSERATHDACIAENVSSYISELLYRVVASLHVHVSTTCMLHTSYSMCMYLVLASQEAIYISCVLRSWIAPARQQCHAFS